MEQQTNNYIEVVKGDILDASWGVIVHSCNTFGIMGSGVARGIKSRYPEAYQVYKEEYDLHGLQLGSNTFCRVEYVNKTLYIVNGVGQDTLGYGKVNTDYGAIRSIFKKVNNFLEVIDPDSKTKFLKVSSPLDTPVVEYGIPLLFPKIGAGRGGGDWGIIEKIILEEISPTRRKILYVVDEEPKYCW
jgi:O-acetyl-ADP-ribose deacetylase (regulator of RNase III)